MIASALHLSSAPAWSPDGRSLAVSAVIDGTPRLVNVPVDGQPPSTLGAQHAVDLVWFPDGRRIVF